MLWCTFYIVILKINVLIFQLRPAEPLVDDICDDDPDNITIVLERAAEHREILISVLELLGVTITNSTEEDIDNLFEFDFLFCNATKVRCIVFKFVTFFLCLIHVSKVNCTALFTIRKHNHLEQ